MKSVDAELDTIAKYLDDLMWADDFINLDGFLYWKISEIEADKEITDAKLTLWSSYLTFTLPVKRKLWQRIRLYKLVEAKAIEFEGKEKAKELLKGLR